MQPKKYSLFILFFALFVSSPSQADWVRPLKPDPLNCQGVAQEDNSKKISLEINTDKKNGQLTIEYRLNSWVNHILGSPPLNLSSEGHLYIQQLNDDYNLWLSSEDIEELANENYSREYKLSGILYLNGDNYTVECSGKFIN